MHQAIPYKSWLPIYTNDCASEAQRQISHTAFNQTVSKGSFPPPPPPSPTSTLSSSKIDMVSKKVSENAVVMLARKGCCMGHVVKRLLLTHGVNPLVHEIREEDETAVMAELEIKKINGDDHDHDEKKAQVQLPALYIGGKLFGELDKVMAAHISGELVPRLKQAGALWL